MSAVLEVQVPAFRPLTLADVQAVMGIEKRAYHHPWTAGIFQDCLRVGYGCWVAELHSVIESYGVMSATLQECHILNLCVRPESQRRGYGRDMLRHLLHLARRRGADTALLEVRPSNHSALRLYDGEGFSEVGVRKAYYPADNGREDALILARDLRHADFR